MQNEPGLNVWDTFAPYTMLFCDFQLVYGLAALLLIETDILAKGNTAAMRELEHLWN